MLDGRKGYRDLSPEDARWAVADLSARGYSLSQIAGWLQCSERHLKRLRAELATQVMITFAEDRNRRDVEGLAREVRALRRAVVSGRGVSEESFSRVEARLAGVSAVVRPGLLS